MNLSFEKKIMGSFLVVSAAFAVMLYAFYYSTKKINSTTEKVKQSQVTLRHCEQILSLSMDIGYSSREYLITGDEQFVASFHRAVDEMESHIGTLRILTDHDPKQQNKIDSLVLANKVQIAFAEKAISLKKQKGTEAAMALINAGSNRQWADNTRHLLNDIHSLELPHLGSWEQASEESMNTFAKVLISLVVFIDLILILVGIMIFQNQKIRQAYEEQLERSNSELESFSYMVSHDLRSPVQIMLGLMKQINRKHKAVVHAELQELLGHVETKCKRMENIINDLLNLARYGKEKIQPAPTDMSLLFHKAWEGVGLAMPHQAKLELSPLPVVEADSSMMEQVLVNLCSNAVKYSSQKAAPVVEVGCSTKGSETTFFIRDNGAGFDMSQSARLFTAFQRLHHGSEFEGTGVGLVLVKKIIEMHKGRIWAESKPGEGATFYFTLPSQAA